VFIPSIKIFRFKKRGNSHIVLSPDLSFNFYYAFLK
jgi:hypothetical protein